MKPDLNLLAVLDAICRTGSVSAAAAALSLSQPAVSHALNRLRAATGDPLFTRSGRGLVPTDRARGMASAAAELVESGRQLLGSSTFDPGTDRPRFHIAASEFAAQTVLPGLLAALQCLAPGSLVGVATIGTTTLRQLEDGTLDLAFWGAAAPAPPLRYAPLFSDHFVAVLRRGHPALAASAGLSMTDYLAFPHAVVALRDPGTSLVDSALAGAGLTRRIGLASHSFSGNLAAVAQSDLIATIPSRLSSALGPSLVTAPVPLQVPSFTYGMIWHLRTNASPAQVWLRDLIQRQVGHQEARAAPVSMPAASIDRG